MNNLHIIWLLNIYLIVFIIGLHFESRMEKQND